MGRRAAVPLPPLFVVVVGLFAVWTWACAIVPPAPAQAAAAAPAAAQALHRLRQELDVLGKELDSEASASAEPAPPVYAAPAVAAPSCAYLPDVDYDDGDAAGVMLEHSDRERCCAACAAHAWCKAAVLSAAFDEPPNACWLKRATHTPKAKPGVVACIPDAAAAHAAQVAIAANAAAADCDFRPDVDFSPSALDPDEPALLDADEWSCCAECSADPSCAAAVLSGPQDTPRFACWIKREAKGEIYKQGVISCRPANRGAAAEPGVAPPAAPPVAPAAAAAPSSKYELRAAPGIEVPSAAELEQRRAAIRGAVAHAWKGYRDMAWGEDSVLPIAGRGTHSGFGCAVTMVDSLDTLWLVGLHAEFKEAVDYISQKSFGEKLSKISAGASVFESTIRILGGLLGAYELSKEPVLLERARQIGERVVSALRADGSCPATFGGGGGGCASLAHGGTTQLELAYLAHHLGEARLSDKSLRFYDAVRARPALDGLWPQCFGARSGRITLGAESDSFYEYLIKVWLLTDKKDDALWRMYDAAVDGMEKHMLSRGADGLLYLDNLDWHGGNSAGKDVAMEHLSCFVPGWLALGAVHQTDPERKARHLAIADEIATTCFAMYDKQPTKIGPERVKRHKMDLSATDTRECILRPEAVEGWWYMAETVPELAHKYRDWGWRSFQAMDSQLRVAHGHASMRDVSRPPGSGNANLLDRMESFWMAETLKYFYLLQDESHPLPLDEFIMNTEAHPMRVLRPKAA